MSDYLKPMNRTVRWLAAAALAVAVLILAGILLLLAISPAQKLDDTKLAVIIAVLGSLLVASAWMLVRLLRGTTTESGRTMMPTWFIRAFGVAFMAGVVWAAWFGNMPVLLAGEMGFVCLAMVMLGGRVGLR